MNPALRDVRRALEREKKKHWDHFSYLYALLYPNDRPSKTLTRPVVKKLKLEAVRVVERFAAAVRILASVHGIERKYSPSPRRKKRGA